MHPESHSRLTLRTEYLNLDYLIEGYQLTKEQPADALVTAVTAEG